MEFRRLVAIGLVLALTGSAAAAQQQRLFKPDTFTINDVELEHIQAVQQHTIFLEIILQKDQGPGGPDVTPFAAIVGLVKKCDRQPDRQLFDNAVLWFNDQFLFGQKQAFQGDANQTPDSAIGENPPDAEIWPNCWIPNGFVHVVPNGTIDEAKQALRHEDDETGPTRLQRSSTFTYQGSFYVTDPNGARWLVDKFIYNLPHHCHRPGEDHDNDTPDNPCTSDNLFANAFGGSETGTMWTVHLQVDSQTQQGFRDQATWAYPNGTLRPGMPYNASTQDDPNTSEDERVTEPPVEYDFLIVVDEFPQRGSTVHNESNDAPAWQGNSHPHRGKDNQTKTDNGNCIAGSDGIGDQQQGCAPATPGHQHTTGTFSVFFNKSAPDFVENNPYWNEDGAPPPVTEDCGTGTSGDPQRDAAIQARNDSFIVCDRQAPSSFHAHNGSETIQPT